jgi:hypothetical protein
VAGPSTIYFPLRSNASALFAGSGVAGVRRRILAAALLNDEVVLESGLHTSWAGATGGFSSTSHGNDSARWQTPRARGQATGERHYVSVRSSDAPDTAPMHPIIISPAEFSWEATFEPFRRELPASASGWLAFGFIDDDGPANEIVRGWESIDRRNAFRAEVRGIATPSHVNFVRPTIVKAGYFDLATAALTGAAVSMDRRHAIAVDERLRAGDAHRLGGYYALEVLLPTEFTWADVPDLRRHRAIRDYRAIVRDVEAAAIRSAATSIELNDLIRREYERHLVAASTRGVPFSGRVALQAIGFVAGLVADSAAPIVGGAAVTAATFVAGEGINRAMSPRWLAIDRRLRHGGRRNGL